MATENGKMLIFHNAEEEHWRSFEVEVDVDDHNEGHYAFAYLDATDEAGVFISCPYPESIGTRLQLKFTARNSREQTFEIEGEVIWANPLRPGQLSNIDPGMGILLSGLTPENKSRLYRYVKTFAYLDREALELG